MQFGPGSTQGQVVTVKQSDNAWDVLRTMARTIAAPFGINAPGDAAIAYAQGTGTDPNDAATQLPSIFAYMQGHPGSTVGQAAANTGNASPEQAKEIDKLDVEKTGGTADQSGLVSDIMGSVFEVLYPWLMFLFALLAAVGGILVLLVALVKSPVGAALPTGRGIGALLK
jgi:hypothetical protein